MTKVRDFLGPYRLARLIRVGSTCAVWEAIKDGDTQRYALKVLRSDQIGNRAEEALLKHEFQVADSLSHPQVIKVFELRNDAKIPYLVLELFSEHNMKQALRQEGPDKLAFYAKRIIEQAAEAIYHLHSKGWVHCDLKPDNILVSREGDVKLIDFTIAQKIRTGLGKLLGRRGKIQGTRSYMSPEQIRGTALDARSDVYSFACVMYELLVGKPPFTATSPNELLEKHLRAQIPSIQAQNGNVTDEVMNLIRIAMAKRADDRPDTMWELLRRFRQHRLYKKAPKRTKLVLPEGGRSDD